MKYIIIISLLLLSGCSTFSTKEEQSVIVNNKTKTATLYPEDKYLSYCGKFSKIEEGTFKEFYEKRVIDSQTLKECYDKHKYLSDFINQLKGKDLESK